MIMLITQVEVVKKLDVRKMTIIGMLSAISIMLSMTPTRIYTDRTG